MARVIRGPAANPTPSQYTLAGGEALAPESVTALFDGTAAAGPFLPCLAVYAQSGELLSRTFPNAVSAGDVVAVTFAPLLRAAPAAGGPAVVASTVSGLGDVFNGKIGFLRAGASPYEFMVLYYDSALAKWVSPAVTANPGGPGTNFTTTSAAYVVVSDASVLRPSVPNYKDLYNAGLRLQIWFKADFQCNTTGQTAFIALTQYGYDDGDANVALLSATPGGELSQPGTAHAYHTSGWVTFDPAAPTKQHLNLITVVKSTGGAVGQYATVQTLLRFVSA